MTSHPAYSKVTSRQHHHLLARLAAARARLLWQVIGLGERTLVGLSVFDDWTAKDLLAHVAAWDEVMTERIELVLAGRQEEVSILTGADEDARNAAFHTERRDWPLQQAVKALVAARADFLTTLARLPDEELCRLHHLPSGKTSVREWTEWRARHDAIHTADLAAWRKAQRLERGTGPQEVLLAGLVAARDELLAAAALIPPEEHASRPICGHWTLKDVLGHIADWEWVGEEGLRHMAAGYAPRVEHIKDIVAWNRAHAEARRDQSWEEIWADLHLARKVLLGTLRGMSQANLTRSFPFPWGQEGTAYQWVCVYLAHDREHAEGLREEQKE